MGLRGPKPGTGGRPKKAIADRIADGNPGRRPLTVIDFGDSAADLEGQEIAWSVCGVGSRLFRFPAGKGKRKYCDHACYIVYRFGEGGEKHAGDRQRA